MNKFRISPPIAVIVILIAAMAFLAFQRHSNSNDPALNTEHSSRTAVGDTN